MDEKTLARFWSKVDRRGTDECWPWTAGKTCGYGVFSPAHHSQRRAHRVAFELVNGQIPDGLFVCHRCNNPPCCNPAHLYIGTHADNMRDRRASGHYAVGDAHPARLHPERVARGSGHGRSKLTEGDVRSLRARYALGGVTYAELGRSFSISGGQASKIIRGNGWSACDA